MEDFRDSLEFTLPDGRTAIAYEMQVNDINKIMGKGKMWDNILRILDSDIRIKNEDGTTSSYNTNQEWVANNFGALIAIRRATIGDDFEFQVKSSDPNDDFGKGKDKQYAVIWLGDTMEDPDTKLEIENPHAVKPILFAEDVNEVDGKENIGFDRESGRSLIYLPKMKQTLVVKLLKGRNEQNLSSEIAKKFANTQVSMNLAMKTVGVLGQETSDSKGEHWTTAKFNKISPKFFETIPYRDMLIFNELYNKMIGGIELEMDSVKFLVRQEGKEKHYDLIENENLITAEGGNQIPFLGKDFFSMTSRRL